MPEIQTARIQAIETSASDGLEGFKAHAVFQEINKKLQEDGEQFVKKIGGVFAFKVKDGPNGQEATWFVDVKNGKGCVHNDTDKKADCTISMSDTDLLAMMTGKMNPQSKLEKNTEELFWAKAVNRGAGRLFCLTDVLTHLSAFNQQ
uniref:Sterol carrier protein 2b n=1 Tax=Acanthochromis polyacanthus TaxID=80966 RepID=A0A3Q1GHP1_9TELE